MMRKSTWAWVMGLLLIAGMLASRAGAETLLLPTNNGFETDTFGTAPGYVGGANGPITGWTAGGAGLPGINPGPSSPFANNGTIPEGSQVAFIQSNSSTTTLSQNVSGFTAGDRYVVYYRENSRSGYATPSVSVNLDATNVVASHTVPAVGGTNPYRTTVGSPFTATAGTHTLTFSSTSTGDGASTIDDVRLYGYSADEIIVLNSSFEWDSFGTFPGYSNGAANGDIAGWASTNTARTGLNPHGGGGDPSPFANNSTIPDGSQVAFIQNATGGDTGTLSQTIDGLTVGETYRVDFRTNARNGNTALLTATFGADTLLSGQSVTASGAEPYDTYSFLVTATSTSQTLTFANIAAAGDHTVLLDAISITEDPAWSGSAWTGDADSGIVQHGATTHAYNLGTSPGNTSINDIDFIAIAGATPSASNFTTSATPASTFNNDSDNNLTGGSLDVADDFIYNGDPRTLSLTGLIPGSTNVLTIYGTGWDAGPDVNRTASFTHVESGNTFSINENQYGNNNGIKIQLTYIADANGNATISIDPETGRTFHMYGFASQVQGYTNLFTDNFNTTGNDLDINPGATDEFNRQSGVYAPLNYTERGGTPSNFTQLGNPSAGADELFFATDNTFTTVTASPNQNFDVAGKGWYVYQVDMNPANNAANGADLNDSDWTAIVFGTSNQTATVNGSDGIGLLIRGNGGYQLFDGTDGVNSVRFQGDLGTDFGIDENGFYNVRIVLGIDAFDDVTTGDVAIYVDNMKILDFTSESGFLDNHVVLAAFNSGSLIVHGFDNLQIWHMVPAPSALPAGLMLLAIAAHRRRRSN